MPGSLTSSVGPVIKRQKLAVDGIDADSNHRSSRIFAPFRTIGLVSSTDVPFTSVPLGKTSFQITTSVGHCLQTYDLKRGLNLTFLTRPQTPQLITASVAWKDRVFAAWGAASRQPGLWVFKRGKKVAELAIPADLTEQIQQLVIFGSWIVARCATRIETWRLTSFTSLSSYDHYTTIQSSTHGTDINEITSICHLPTYLNKVFLGKSDGSVEIWNVSTGRFIHSLLPPTPDSGAVTALQPTTALSLLAIAYSEGPLTIHDVRLDKIAILLHSERPITSISFRTDGRGAGADGLGDGIMATTGPFDGDVTFWDLNKGGRVTGVLRGAHNPPSAIDTTIGGGINKVEFLAGQPLIITSGRDNCLRSWIFDDTPYSPLPRILHMRGGHAAPAVRLQFLPAEADGADAGGKWLLSASKDRALWAWSLRRDGQSTEISQGSVKKKAKKLGLLTASSTVNGASTSLDDLRAPEITCIASCLNRDGGMGAFAGSGGTWQKERQRHQMAADATRSSNTGWESIVTGHKGDKYARTWFWGRRKAGRWALETSDGSPVSSVAISPCGTFAVVGAESGGIDMFNLQSGKHRVRFPARLTPAEARRVRMSQATEAHDLTSHLSKGVGQRGLGRHTKKVTGVVVNNLNSCVISCSKDGKIKFWNPNHGILTDEIDWYPSTCIEAMRYHAANDLIALACDDLSIKIVDVVTRKTIRELLGCPSEIRDLSFSSDGRWIIAAAGDSSVRIWDLPTGHLIDAIRMTNKPNALAISQTGEFLAVACETEIGVHLWSNKTLFKHISTRHIGEEEIANVEGPTVSGEGGQGLLDEAFAQPDSENDDPAFMDVLDQVNDEMTTLSLVPKSRWQTLLHLESIKQRNRPIEAPKVPEKAPFFLPSVEKASAVTPLPSEKRLHDAADRSRISKMDRTTSEREFTVALRHAHQSKQYEALISHMKTLSPSAADLEIRSLDTAKSSNELVTYVEALTSRLAQKRDYELVQAWMTVFLRLHGDFVAVHPELREALRLWREEQQRQNQRLGQLVAYCNGVVGFLRSPRT